MSGPENPGSKRPAEIIQLPTTPPNLIPFPRQPNPNPPAPIPIRQPDKKPPQRPPDDPPSAA